MPEPTVPIDLLYWLLAILPVVALLVLLAIMRWSAAQAGPIGFFVAAILAYLLFQTPFQTIAVATVKGFWDAIFILYIVWTALLLYEVVRTAGVFKTFEREIAEFTPNRLVQYLAFALVFVLFLQSTAGFGTPIAVVAPLLIGLGIKPLYAVTLALIGHVWGNTFGSLAISWIAMNLIISPGEPTATLISSAVLLALAVVASIITLVWFFGGRKAVAHAWPLIVIFGGIYGLGQILIAPLVPELAAVVPAAVALGAIFLVPRIDRFSKKMDIEVNKDILDRDIEEEVEERKADEVEGESKKERNGRTRPTIVGSFIPYIALVVFSILGLLLTEFIEPLGNLQFGPATIETTTGYDIVREAEDEYSPLNPIGHAGTHILLAALTGFFFFKGRGHLRSQDTRGIMKRTAINAVPPTVAIIGFLTLAQVMDHSGQTFVLAQGLAAVSPASLYPAAAVFVGIIGAFITSSNTASNVLFASLHVEAAATLGIGDGAVLGGQMAGGAYGNAIAPANVALGTGTAGISGQEGAVLRITLAWTLVVGVLGAILLVLMQPLL
jgi:lactate permease